MDEVLPEEFDVILIGTGLPESVLSGALSRIGKTVLHVDSNEYYGGSWASFNIKTFDKLMSETQMHQEDNSNPVNLEALISEDEEFLLMSASQQNLSNCQSYCYLSKQPVEPNVVAGPDEVEISDEKDGPVDVATTAPTMVQKHSDTEDLSCRDVDFEERNNSDNDNEKPGVSDKQSGDPAKEKSTDNDSRNGQVDAFNNATSEEKLENASDQSSQADLPHKETPLFPFYEKFYENWRRFNLDLSPKVMFSRGQLVELLIQSNVCRYLEFRNVTRTLTVLSGENRLQPVPCSRADVFKSKFVTVVEKRILMRFLTLCANFEQHPQEYEAYKDRPFQDFLQSKHLSTKVQHFIIHSIAMVSEQTSTMEGLHATQKFLKSLGRYGSSHAFLYPMYGVGELPQAFSRLSAVFGGTFCLRRRVIGIVADKTSRAVKGVIDSTGQRIKCQHLVLDESHLPDICRSGFKREVSRAIYVTNKSVSPSETEEVSLITLPPIGNFPLYRVIEAGPLCCLSPKNYYVVHALTKPSCVDENAIVDLKETFHSAEKTMFAGTAAELEIANNNESDKQKPAVLWAAYFNMMSCGVNNDSLPGNVYVMSSPGFELGFDKAMNEARRTFEIICPDEEFLPRAPEPEEIVFDDEGYKSENNGNSRENSNEQPEAGNGDYMETEEDLQEEEEPDVQGLIDQEQGVGDHVSDGNGDNA
ncbi:rab proteins geranylgeranyltransferase component A 2-like [Clavelina lepadiformis]|uniref:rab proteins geranylgeranyltransferase component A 2-like n=1 Tax=Clavelina lepadiformis TaxID=159417 RepID=UPI004041CAC5